MSSGACFGLATSASAAARGIAGRWGRCSTRIDEATGRTTREWCSACAVGLDPCLSSDVPTRRPSQSRGEPEPGSFEVGFLCCIPIAWALLRTISRLSPLALRVRGEPKAALASRASHASSCGAAVRERRLGFSDSVNAVGNGVFTASYLPKNDAPCGRPPRSPWTWPCPHGPPGLMRRRRRRGMLPG